ncbi:MAG TPA: secretin N-terminal domain-containing protein, partial [Phycisphaerae bacterium]|nr:secretin N-terminal domain-containing protein [Phycisphaerae bacterium]
TEPPPRFEPDTTTNQLLVAATESQFPEIEKLIEKIKAATVLASQTQTFDLKFAKAAEIVGVLQTMLGEDRGRGGRGQPSVPTRVAAMPNINAILVQGPPDKLALAKDLITKFDVEAAAGDSIVRVITLKNAKAEALAATLRAMLPRPARGEVQPIVLQADPATNSILLTAPADRRKDLEALIAKLDAETIGMARETRILKLQNASAAGLRSILVQLFADPRGSGRRGRGAPADDEPIVITAAPDDRSLVVDGPRAKVDEIAALAKLLDTKEATGALEVRTYDLPGGNAAEAARSLSRLFAEQRGRTRTPSAEPQPRFEADTTANQLLVAATATQFEEIEKVIHTIQKTVLAAETKTYTLKFAQAEAVAGLLQSMLADSGGGRPGRTTGSVRIAAVPEGNAIVISAPPDKHAAAKGLIETFDKQEMAGESVVRIIRLENAKAENVANVLRSMIPRPARGRAQEVFLQADAETNSILLRAPAAQRQVVEDLVARLDKDTRLIVRETRVLKMEGGGARAAAAMLDQLYGGSPVGRRGRGAPEDPERVIVSASPDDTALVVDAPRDTIGEIAKLVETIAAEGPGEMQVRTYDVTGGDVGEVARSLSRLFAQQRGPRGASEVQPRFEPDTASNRILVAATEKQFAQIEPIIKQLKTAQLAAKTETYLLTHARAADLVGVLQQMLADAPSRGRRGSAGQVRVAALPAANAIVIAAPPDQHAVAKGLIETFDKQEMAGESIVRIIKLENARAESVVAVLRNLIPPPKRGGVQEVFLEADAGTNSILLRAPASQRQVVEDLVARLDKETKLAAREIRVVHLDSASAAGLAPMLTQLFPGPGSSRGRRGRAAASDDPDRIVIAASPDDRSLVIDAPRDRIEPIAQMAQTMDAQGVGVPLVRAYQFTQGSAAEAARALTRLLAPQRGQRPAPGEIAPRFEADSATNQLLVAAPESRFQEIESLIEKLQKGAGVASQTKTYSLKFAKATEIVDVLQTMLTGAVRGRSGRAQGGQEVRLAAAGGINAILVQGPPDQHALAEELIKTLDREEMGAGAMVQIVRLKNAQSDTLARAVGESLRAQRARGAAPEDQVTVTAETNSNSVLVRGPAADMP